MVYGDYELINTKRVNRERKSRNPWQRRFNEARGGLGTAFFTLTGASVAYSFSGLRLMEVVPNRAFFSKPGFSAYMKSTGVKVLLPTYFAYNLGILLFGDYQEYVNLTFNAVKFDKEMNEYNKEMYYA